MHQSFAKIYVLILIIFVVEKSDCKQGGYQGQLMNVEDIDFYYGAACLSYGHSCWGAHGKRNADISNNPNAWFLQRMAMIQKPADKDPSIDQNQSQEEDISKYFNIFKTYMQRNSKKNINDDSVGNWDIEPSKYIPKGRYYEDQVLDPRMAYKLMVNSEMYKKLYGRKPN